MERGRWLQGKYLNISSQLAPDFITLVHCLPLLPPPRLLAGEWFLQKQTVVLHFRVTHVKVNSRGMATRMVGGALAGHASVSQLVQMRKEQLGKHSEPVRYEPHLDNVKG